MKAKASEPCVVKNGYCIAHKRPIRDGGVACSIHKIWEAAQCECWVCAVATPRETAMSLHGKFLKFRDKGKLELSFVVRDLSQVERVHWSLVNNCPEDSGLCPKCVAAVEVFLPGTQICTKVPDFDFDTVPVFRPLVRRATETVDKLEGGDAKERILAIRAVADSILGRKSLFYADKELGVGGRGTECIVAANDPGICQEWGNWQNMPTINRPNEDGTPSAGFFGFCPSCADVLAAAGYKLGPSLCECITGKKPAMHIPDNVVDISTPFALAAKASKTARGRTPAEQKAHKAARAAAYKATYIKGKSDGGGKQKGRR